VKHRDNGGLQMTTQVETILKTAMLLGADDRLDIAERLLETLGPDDDLIADDELAAELQRRSDEMNRDPSVAIAWETLRDEP